MSCCAPVERMPSMAAWGPNGSVGFFFAGLCGISTYLVIFQDQICRLKEKNVLSLADVVKIAEDKIPPYHEARY